MPNNYTFEEVQEQYPDYEIEGHLSSGGFKDVFKATLDGDDVVVKLFPVEGRQMQRRARREARAMEKVDTSILVDLEEHFVDELAGKTTYVMVEDFVPGRTLGEIISEDGPEKERSLNVIESLLLALEDFQKHNLVHRDIKPSNIIITPSDEMRLLDVGIVRFQEEESLTPDHADRGPSTPPYAAPEVLRNDKDAQDVRTDLFSSGIVFYESLVGSHPFDVEGMSRPEAIQNGARKEMIQEEVADDELAQQLTMFFKSLTEHEQHERYRKPEFALEELNMITGETQ